MTGLFTGLPELAELQKYLDHMLACAQTLRIQQVQATNDAGWVKSLKAKADAAWQELNVAHKVLTDGIRDSLRASEGVLP